MEISFHHANPDAGNEAFLLRFDDGGDETPCVLVDAGHGTDLDAILGPRDRLEAICLTHAHLDHYSELTAAHRHGAPILTAPATAAVLEDVFDVADHEYDVQTTDTVADAVTPVDDWTAVADGVEVHPVPAGHVPGGVGFLLRVEDGDESHNLLATGDFTRRRAGGFPGLDPDGVVDVDTLFLTAATNDTFESELTEGLGTALEHAHAGSRTLVATSGLFGAQCAYLLSALAVEFDLDVPVRVVGQVAKHYESLGYDHPGVETIPLFDDPRDCLDPGVITIAGPEVPHERSSGRLFGLLREDPGACVVQLVGSGEDPLTDGQCTLRNYECVNHPTRETLVDVHDAVEPTETVIVHRHGGAQGVFNDLDSVVWGSGDTEKYTLYDGRNWRLPEWMGGGTVSRTHGRGRQVQQFADASLLDSFTLPALDRHGEVDLEAEGVDLDAIATLLHRDANAAKSPDVPTSISRQQPTDDTESMTTDPNTADQSTDESSSSTPAALFNTVRADLGDDVDPEAQQMLDEAKLTPEQFTEALRLHQRRQAEQAQSTADETGGEVEDETDADTEVESGAMEGDEAAETEAEAAAEAAEGRAEVDPAESPDEPPEVDDRPHTGEEAEQDDTGGSAEETEGETLPRPDEVDGAPEATETGGAPEATETDVGSEEERDEEVPPVAEEATSSIHLDLNPLVVALARRTLERQDATDGESLGELVAEAVHRYVLALLAGDAAGDDSEQFAVDVSTSSHLERLLGGVAEDDGFDSTAELTAQALATSLGGDARPTVALRELGSSHEHLDAVVQNDDYVFETRESVVEAAIFWSLTHR